MNVVATDRLYRGVRTKDNAVVTVHISPGDNRPLEMTDTVFDWGRPTAGALALTDALMLDVFGGAATPELNERLYHEIVLKLPFIDPWVLWQQDIRDWAEKAKASE